MKICSCLPLCRRLQHGELKEVGYSPLIDPLGPIVPISIMRLSAHDVILAMSFGWDKGQVGISRETYFLIGGCGQSCIC